MNNRPDPTDPIAFPDQAGTTVTVDPPAPVPAAKMPEKRGKQKRAQAAVETARDFARQPPMPLGRWSFAQVGVQLLEPNPWQPRKTFPPAEEAELTESVQEKGVLQPLLVRPKPGTGTVGGPGGDKPHTYQIAAGERRWRAAKRAGLPAVPCYVRDIPDEQMSAIAVIENAEREGLPILEEADAVKSLLQLRQPNGEPYTAEVVAAQLGRGMTWVHQRLKLTELIPDFREALNDGRILLAHALIAARLAPSAQDRLADHMLYEHTWDPRTDRQKRGALTPADRIESPAAWDKYVKDHILLDLDRAPFSKTDPSLNPAQGACEQCDLRTGNLPSLFGDVKAGICTAPACFTIKMDVHLRRAVDQILADKGVVLYDGYGPPPKGSIAAEFNGAPRDQWEEANKKKCEYSTWGIIAGGQRSNRIGERLRVCLERTCKVHHPFDGGRISTRGGIVGRKPTEKEREARKAELFDQEVQRRLKWRLGRLAAEGIVKRGPRAVLTHMLHFAWDETIHDAQVALLRDLGIEVPKQQGNNTADPDAAFHAYLKDPKPITRDQMAVYLTFAESIKFSYVDPVDGKRIGGGFHKDEPAYLGNVIKDLKLNVPSIEKQVRAELTAERAAKGKRKPPAAPATKGGKAGSPSSKARKR